jgi:hypothetical protein
VDINRRRRSAVEYLGAAMIGRVFGESPTAAVNTGSNNDRQGAETFCSATPASGPQIGRWPGSSMHVAGNDPVNLNGTFWFAKCSTPYSSREWQHHHHGVCARSWHPRSVRLTHMPPVNLGLSGDSKCKGIGNLSRQVDRTRLNARNRIPHCWNKYQVARRAARQCGRRAAAAVFLGSDRWRKLSF